MSIVESILNLIKREVRDRGVVLPDGKKGLLMMDAAGNERVVVDKEKPLIHNTFSMASISDMLGFTMSIPERYGDRAAAFRELVVYVNNEDIPSTLALFDKLDSERNPVPCAKFALREHRDFARWFRQASNMTQTQFRNLLLQLEGQHDQKDDDGTGMPSLAKRLEQLTFKVEINYQDSIEHARSREVVYKENEMVGSVEIPKTIRVTCPVFSGTSYMCNVEMEVLIVKPKDEKEKIKFSLVPYDKSMSQILEEAAIFVASEEFIKPMQVEIEKFAKPIAPAYIRNDIGIHEQSMIDETYRTMK